jgi:RND family efflux transporter MFP subunit
MFDTKIDKISLAVSAFLLVLAIVIFPRLFSSAPNIISDDVGLRRVATASIGALSSHVAPLPLTGEIESESQVTLRAQSQGEVRGVYRTLGSYVTAGTIIAELENSQQRASVKQAEASLDSTIASLAKIDSGARSEDYAIAEARLKKDQDSVAEAENSLRDTIKSAYNNADSAIRANTDIFFSNPRSSNPQIIFPTGTQVEVNMEFSRLKIESILEDWSVHLSSITPDEASGHLAVIQDFLNDASLAITGLESSSNIPQSSIDSWKLAVSTARSLVSSSIASLSVARESYNGKVSQLSISEQEFDIVKTGARSEDIAIVESQVAGARAALAGAHASLEKTIIRSPISGTINRLEISTGDFVSAFADVAEVSNNNALQVKAFITEEDRHDISVGASVLIEGGIEGVVTSIAPSLNPTTRKIEITIGILNSDATLTNGESVKLLINRVGAVAVVNGDFTIPLAALKINPDNIVVFTVSNDGNLVGHPVVVGPIRGSEVIIESGVNASMEIVLDARGLVDGEEVIIE